MAAIAARTDQFGSLLDRQRHLLVAIRVNSPKEALLSLTEGLRAELVREQD
jgi:hypothetical protein